MGQLRVTHCPVNFAGIPWQNVLALRRKGIDARLVVFNRELRHPEADWSLDRRGGLARQQLAQWRALGEISDDELASYAARVRPGRTALRYFDQLEWDT